MSAVIRGRVVLAAVLIGAVSLALCRTATSQEFTDPKPTYDGTELDPALDPPQIDMPPKWDDAKREKLVAEIERKLGRFKPMGANKKKDPQDYYLIGTADIVSAQSADVRFLALQGQRVTAEFLVDYVAAAPENVIRRWQVFARFKEASEAQAGVAQVRQQYDQMVAYREKLAEAYRVANTRRC